MHRLLARYSLQASVIGPGILDRNGVLIASARVDPVPKISLQDRNIFRIHAEDPDRYQLYISAPDTRPVDQRVGNPVLAAVAG
ncbi:MAG: hypothetical protein WDN48_20710 [Pseudolabrys sp.]